MKTVILKGQEITIGSEVRFIDDRDMYFDVPSINKPIDGNHPLAGQELVFDIEVVSLD